MRIILRYVLFIMISLAVFFFFGFLLAFWVAGFDSSKANQAWAILIISEIFGLVAGISLARRK